MNRPRDLPFEALASATATDWNTGRGELNFALKSIREQMPGVDDTELATEILYRAKLYEDFWGPAVAITPAALAKHWLRVVEQGKKKEEAEVAEAKRERRVTNASAPPRGCLTCGDDGLVLIRTRASDNPHSGYEEYGICPDCRAA